MLKIENLSAGYGKQKVLRQLSLHIPMNTIHGLVGLNGSGKTTLLNSIYGLKKQSEGQISIAEKTIKRREIGYLETTNYFYPRITGMEYLNLFNTQNPNFDILKWNELFELPLTKIIDNYSTGMKKKLALLGVICLDRNVLVLDEPFNGVDLETVQKIKSILLNLKSKKLILITSHILESLLPICDSISYLNGGHIQFTKNKAQFETIEKDIFSTLQDRIDRQVQELLG